jgi:hypothetical protein
MQEILFDVDLFMIEHNLCQILYREVQRKFVESIIKKGKEIKANKLVTNGNLAAVIQGSVSFYVLPLPKKFTGELILVGTLNGIDIFIDPYMRWDDNHVHFERVFDKKFVRKLKIKTLENSLSEEEKDIKIGRIYSGLVIDTKTVLM